MTRRYELADISVPDDTGCKLWHKCQLCPFVPCVYELKFMAIDKAEQNIGIQVQTRAGVSVEEISRRYGITQQSVFRILRNPRIVVSATF